MLFPLRKEYIYTLARHLTYEGNVGYQPIFQPVSASPPGWGFFKRRFTDVGLKTSVDMDNNS